MFKQTCRFKVTFKIKLHTTARVQFYQESRRIINNTLPAKLMKMLVEYLGKVPLLNNVFSFFKKTMARQDAFSDMQFFLFPLHVAYL